jgi:putative membrane protein
MKSLIYLLFTLAVLVLGLTFVVKNPAPVDLFYYFGWHWTGPIAVVLLVVLAIGMLLGFLASLALVFRARRRLGQARKQQRKMEQELTNLRSLPIKDPV